MKLRFLGKDRPVYRIAADLARWVREEARQLPEEAEWPPGEVERQSIDDKAGVVKNRIEEGQ